MFQKLPTRWIAVLSLFFAVMTWNACSKDYSLEPHKSSIGDLFPDDSTDNPGDSTNDDEPGDSTGNGPIGDTTVTTAADVEFLKKASIINHAAIANATLAKDRGTAQAVRDLGSAQETRFKAAQGDLEKAAAALSATVPDKTDATHQAATNGFLELDGKTFDVSYLDYQMSELQKAIDLYRAQIDNGRDATVKAYAEKYLPYLQEFLQTASIVRATM